MRVASLGVSGAYLGSPALYPLRESKGLGRIGVVAQKASAVQDASTEVARRLYVGNIPRTVTNSELASIFGEHGSVEKAEVSLLVLPHGSLFSSTVFLYLEVGL